MMSAKRHLVALGSGLALVAATLPAANATNEPIVEDLGEPLQDVLLIGGGLGPGPAGDPVLWSVATSSPATLNAVDPDTGAVVESYPLDGSGGAWALEVTESGSVYVGAYGSSRLFEWTAEQGVRDLGNPLSSAHFVWSVTSDPEGNVYGGMSPNGAVFGYDPQTEAFRDYGRVSEADYVRSIDYYDGVIYAGTSTPATIVAIDADSGEVEELESPDRADADADYVYDLDIQDGYMYARYGEAQPDDLFVFDLEAEEWVDHIPNAHGLQISESDDDGLVYLIADGALSSYDPQNGELTPTDLTLTGRVTNTRGIGLTELDDPDFPGLSVVGLLWRGSMYHYNIETGKYRFLESEIEGTPIPVTVLGEGVDNTVHAGGFLSGGFATMDIHSGDQQSFQRFAQLEGMVAHDELMYIGGYPDGRIYSYDPALPWHSEEYSPAPEGDPAENPELLVNLVEENQMRTPAMVSAGRYVAVGTEPGLNQYGGLLLLWDPQEKEVAYVERHLIPDQSIVSLAYRDGVLYGGSSIYGAYTATPPRADQAVAFAFDLDSHDILWESNVVDGAAHVDNLTFDGDGKLWATAAGQVLELDPVSGERVGGIEAPGGRSAEQIEYSPVSDSLFIDWGAAGIYEHHDEVSTLFASQNPRVMLADTEGHLWFGLGDSLYRVAVADRGDAGERDAEEAALRLADALAGYVDSGDVGGPIVNRLTNAIERVQHHLEVDRTAQAASATERFLRHVESPNPADTLTEEAQINLGDKATEILDLLK